MRRILVADDSGVIRQLVASYLSVFDAQLVLATSGTEAWESFLQINPDLVISDIEMPGLGGVELAQRIRQHAPTRVPIILISAAQSEEGRSAVSSGDADAFLQKPVASDVLTDTVARLLGIVPEEASVQSNRNIRVVIADDTEVGRQMLSRMVGLDPRFHVVGLARDGAEAVALSVREKPQLVLMDALMPVMDGIEATKRIMKEAPTRVVIVTAESGTPATAAALDATRAGALDLLVKPSWQELGAASTAATLERLRELSEVPVIRRWHQTKTPARPRSIPPSARTRALAICASTGGPAVLSQLLSRIAPALKDVSVLIVQHVLAGFSPALADWLTETSGVRVELAKDGIAAGPGMVVLAPDGHHLLVDSAHRLQVVDEAPVGAHRPSGNLLFESAAQAYGTSLLAVILTGMGRDGVDGLRLARSRGGTVLAQAPETCAVPGMPSAAIDAGVVDLILTPEQLAEEIAERLGFRPRGER